MKIVTVLGARPQFIKAATVSRSLAAQSGARELILHTGQHFDANMSDIFFSELGIQKPAFHLDINGGSHGQMTGKMIDGIEKVLLREKPDMVLVYGDTNSTLAGALAASKLLIPVAHVEAGLRSFNKKMPEEQNRILTDHLSSWLFTPTKTATHNLKNEGITTSGVQQVGDVMFDAALYFGKQADEKSKILTNLGLRKKEFILSTIHRAENTDSPGRLKAIFEALQRISKEVKVVLPLHPRTKNILKSMNLTVESDAIQIIDPVGYLDMVMLEKNSALIACDSGGVQKEAFFYEVPCVTLRDETEWVELVELGWNKVIPPTCQLSIFTGIQSSLGSKGKADKPYGDGNAAALITEKLTRS